MFSVGSQFSQRYCKWTEWKAIYNIKGLPLQWETDDDIYTIWTYDGPEVLITQIWKNSVPESATSSYSQVQNDLDKLDFETNFQALGNKSLSQIDTDGAQIVRVKAAKRGWTYGAVPMELTTATIGSLYSKLQDGTNRSGISLKFYEADRTTEITDQAVLDVNTTRTVRTVLDFEPPFDYEIIGGALRIGTDIGFDCRLWIIAVPDIPAAYGGSKEMAGGINLKFLSPQQLLEVDGRVSKNLLYNSQLHTNKLRFIFEHAASSKIDIHINIELFRQ